MTIVWVIKSPLVVEFSEKDNTPTVGEERLAYRKLWFSHFWISDIRESTSTEKVCPQSQRWCAIPPKSQQSSENKNHTIRNQKHTFTSQIRSTSETGGSIRVGIGRKFTSCHSAGQISNTAWLTKLWWTNKDWWLHLGVTYPLIMRG